MKERIAPTSKLLTNRTTIMNDDLIYVYCISRSPLVLSHKMESEGLRSIIIDGFYVFVRYVSEDEFSEENFKKKLSDIQWLESGAREHLRIISMIMEKSTVIPFKFGTIFITKANLKKFITEYSVSLNENFHNISGKEEWSVKIYCNRKAMSEQIDELSEDSAALEEQIMASSPGKAFLLKRKKNDLIENEVDRICKNYGQKYFNEFNKLSESVSLNNLLPKELTGREDNMILNATFLINKSNMNEFQCIVDKLRKEDGNTGFNIEATGPWPPFSFISIKEKQ